MPTQKDDLAPAIYLHILNLQVEHAKANAWDTTTLPLPPPMLDTLEYFNQFSKDNTFNRAAATKTAEQIVANIRGYSVTLGLDMDQIQKDYDEEQERKKQQEAAVTTVAGTKVTRKSKSAGVKTESPAPATSNAEDTPAPATARPKGYAAKVARVMAVIGEGTSYKVAEHALKVGVCIAKNSRRFFEKDARNVEKINRIGAWTA